MQAHGPAVIVFQFVESCKSGLDFWVVELTQPWKERVFLISGVLGRGFSEVTYGRLD